MQNESEKSALARKGEELASLHLSEKGFLVLERNVRIGHGELDIVAKDGDMFVFVEVKTRESAFLTDPVHLVPVSKQKQMIRLADRYLKIRDIFAPARFDIVIVVHNRQYTRIEHTQDAFYPMSV